jgi:hypothetical protein
MDLALDMGNLVKQHVQANLVGVCHRVQGRTGNPYCHCNSQTWLKQIFPHIGITKLPVPSQSGRNRNLLDQEEYDGSDAK